jgi:hypothetical protein
MATCDRSPSVRRVLAVRCRDEHIPVLKFDRGPLDARAVEPSVGDSACRYDPPSVASTPEKMTDAYLQLVLSHQCSPMADLEIVATTLGPGWAAAPVTTHGCLSTRNLAA